MTLTQDDFSFFSYDNEQGWNLVGLEVKTNSVDTEEAAKVRDEILQAIEDVKELRQLKRTVCYCNTTAGRKENCACHCHKIEQKYTELIKKRIGRLPTFCRICNQKLAFQSTQPNHAVLGCTGNEKKGRKVADDHYAQSRTEIGYDQLKICEGIEQTLRSILKEDGADD